MPTHAAQLALLVGTRVCQSCEWQRCARTHRRQAACVGATWLRPRRGTDGARSGVWRSARTCRAASFFPPLGPERRGARLLAMALPSTLDLTVPGGRLRTPHGDVLFCPHCAENSDPALFTYLHGFYVRCEGAALRDLMRSLGANYSIRGHRIMCPYCTSFADYSVHEGLFRLWRSVPLPRAQFADAWAAVDTTDWTEGGHSELSAAADALVQGPRLPTMLGREGP